MAFNKRLCMHYTYAHEMDYVNNLLTNKPYIQLKIQLNSSTVKDNTQKRIQSRLKVNLLTTF